MGGRIMKELVDVQIYRRIRIKVNHFIDCKKAYSNSSRQVHL